MDDLRARQRAIRPQMEAVEALKAFVSEARLESNSVDADLAEAARLPELSKQRDENLATLKTIRTPDLEAKRGELQTLKKTEVKLRTDRDELLRKGRQDQLTQARSEAKAAQEAFQRLENKFSEVAADADISAHLRRLEELREEVNKAFPVKRVAADEFKERAHDADKLVVRYRSELVAARLALAAVPTYGARFAELDAESTDNLPWDARLKQIQDAEIREYELKAAEEKRNKQELFRTQVLEKLRERLEWVSDQMKLLEMQLRDPIGNNRYHIKARPNRDAEYGLYRKLVDAAAATRGDELLFATWGRFGVARADATRRPSRWCRLMKPFRHSPGNAFAIVSAHLKS